ncbi:hypothetical protein F5B20DRAFT_232974 [Whalleya microplaca]|nr:hypothetical protein F5B20DRAFT_232974 [Whalleya microplaca]
MLFSSLSTLALALTVSATAIKRAPEQIQDADLSVRADGGKCKINLTQFKDAKSEPAYFTGKAYNATGNFVGSYRLQFKGGDYPVVVRGFHDYLLITKKDKDDVAPLQYQYLEQKWASDSKQCEQKDYVGDKRDINCSFDC